LVKNEIARWMPVLEAAKKQWCASVHLTVKLLDRDYGGGEAALRHMSGEQ
jgi:hypothetical protein